MNTNYGIAKIPLRRAELISPMGVGAISTNSKGVNMMVGALDKWYNMSSKTDITEYIFHEPRLQKILNVNEFRLPPDYRGSNFKRRFGNEKNTDNEIPMLRFPTWHYCNKCRKMKKYSFAHLDNKIKCSHCDDKYSRMVQVPLVVVCSNGHIDDFPWVEWVHETRSPQCNGPLKLISTGGATLSSMQVQCTSCDKKRTLSGITSGQKKEKSKLHTDLEPGQKYLCTGRKHWYGTDSSAHEPCDEVPFVLLKNSTNVYYPNVISAIFLPGNTGEEIRKITDILLSPNVSDEIDYLKSMDVSRDRIIDGLKRRFSGLFGDLDQKVLGLALDMLEKENSNDEEVDYEDIDTVLKHQEYMILKEGLNSDHLKIVKEYDANDDRMLCEELGISKINLVPRLRDTRVLYGFERLTGTSILNPETIKKGKELLFHYPERNDWLPGYIVYGEGIFIEFDDDKLFQWEKSVFNTDRFYRLLGRNREAEENHFIRPREILPRFVMLHTLAHLLIQEFIFECGYSTSSLRERIYVSGQPERKMNAILIYTASGDSEGTLGGLVRLGKKERLLSILERAIEKSQWCSSDPVCNDIGMSTGQGVHHLNVAACHNCSYLPETSCEEFNRYLDRGLVSALTGERTGFFDSINK
ncbi:DUF1998 domain-containing protein [Bacillus sp. REN16]|uniref:DUF1998 domain-containing protein n=1 Tax=Bacillus sp. REN16 TaxID=2887296 RepID=UPI001E41E31C|nr:DUF1998 domain-containing protein [Bacillus sp. REN16]MCC3359103.1 DUF1998 domain-containing protein [Bacillus sp. REN16]